MCTSNESPPRLPLSKHEFTIDRCQRQPDQTVLEFRPSDETFVTPCKHTPNSIRIECIPSANLNRIRYFIKIVRKVSDTLQCATPSTWICVWSESTPTTTTTTRKTISKTHIDPEMDWNSFLMRELIAKRKELLRNNFLNAFTPTNAGELRPVFYGSRWLSSTAPNQNVITDPGAHNAHLSLRRRCSAFDGILASSTNLDLISFNFSCRITPSPTLVQLLFLCLAPLSTNWHFICMLYDD